MCVLVEDMDIRRQPHLVACSNGCILSHLLGPKGSCCVPGSRCTQQRLQPSHLSVQLRLQLLLSGTAKAPADIQRHGHKKYLRTKYICVKTKYVEYELVLLHKSC